MKRLILAAAMLAAMAGSVRANPLGKLARNAGGTLRCMVWACHDPAESAVHTGTMFAFGYQARQVQRVNYWCIGCAETSPLLGQHPSDARVYVTEFAFGFVMANVTHALRRTGPSHGLWTAPTALVSGLTMYGAIHDKGVADLWQKARQR